MRVLLFCLFAMISGMAAAQSAFKASQMDTLLARLEEKDKCWGQLAIRENGKTRYAGSNGWKTLPEIPANRTNNETRFRIGSISKTFTAAMIFQLIEAGKLSLDTRLSTFFSTLPNADKITVAQMLNHSSGLFSFTELPDYMSFYENPQTQAQMLARLENQAQVFAPGERHEYSNSNYILLGYILEKVTKSTYPKELDKRIIQKLGLKNTGYGGPAAGAKNDARSFDRDEQKQVELAPETDMSVPGGAGAIVSTASDLCAFIEGLFEGKLVSRKSLDSMQTMQEGYGMGLFEYPFYDKMGFGHNGGIDGFQSTLAYYPEEKVAVCCISNALDYSLNDVLIYALSEYFGKPYQLPTFTPFAFKSEDLDKYEGVYSTEQIPLKITIRKDNTTLTAQATGQGRIDLDANSATLFRHDQFGVVIEFKIEPDQSVRQFTLRQGGQELEFKKE